MNLTASRPFFPVKALALPELTTSARAFPDFNFSRHHSTGAEGHLERVEHARDARAGVEQREQHVGASFIANAGGARSPT